MLLGSDFGNELVYAVCETALADQAVPHLNQTMKKDTDFFLSTGDGILSLRLSIRQERTGSLIFLSVLSKFSPFAHFYVNFSASSREAAFSLTPCGFAGKIALR